MSRNNHRIFLAGFLSFVFFFSFFQSSQAGFFDWFKWFRKRDSPKTTETMLNSRQNILYTLSISKTGSGVVTSDDRKINCGNQCQASYLADSKIVLKAEADNNYKLDRWNGCDKVSDGKCQTTLNKSKIIVAKFSLKNSSSSQKSSSSSAIKVSSSKSSSSKSSSASSSSSSSKSSLSSKSSSSVSSKSSNNYSQASNSESSSSSLSPSSSSSSVNLPTQLQSEFLSKDNLSQKILNEGMKYDIGEFELKDGESKWVSIDNYAYRIVSAIRMLSYDMERDYCGMHGQGNCNFSVELLKKFQKKNNISESNYIDKNTLIILDSQLAKVEKNDVIAKKHPLYNKFITPFSTEVPKDHYIANIVLALDSFPSKLVDWNNDLTVITQMFKNDSVLGFYCDAGYYPEYAIGELSSNYNACILDSSDNKHVNKRPLSDFLSTRIFLHEYAHWFKQDSWSKGVIENVINKEGFYSISWDPTNSWEPRRFSQADRINMNTGKYLFYGYDAFEFVSYYAMSSPEEDFAESFARYVMEGNLFKEATKYNQFAKQKYEWLKENMFNSREYNTGVYTESIKNVDSLVGDYYQDAYSMMMNYDHKWERTFSYF